MVSELLVLFDVRRPEDKSICFQNLSASVSLVALFFELLLLLFSVRDCSDVVVAVLLFFDVVPGVVDRLLVVVVVSAAVDVDVGVVERRCFVGGVVDR